MGQVRTLKEGEKRRGTHTLPSNEKRQVKTSKDCD
jgi:hypothetical protein